MSIEARKPHDLTVSEALIAEANALGLDVAGAAEQGIARAIKAEKEPLWRIENAGVIRVEREHLEKHGSH
ncbi:type II toxin-antitoxin system CcdA family antitoxin [Rhizobium arsenicireducens]